MSKVSKISYRFQDSSKPPRFHRSYTIVITAQSVSLTVDCYDEILAERNYAFNPEGLNHLILKMEQLRINYKNTEDSNSQCKGGTTEIIECFSDEEKSFSGHVYHCGGKSSGNLSGDIQAFADGVKKLIPDFSTVLSL